jgi:ketosteroid isomerase-like protein
MGVEENKRAARQFLSGMMNSPDFSMVADDVEWWLQGRGTFNREQVEGGVGIFPSATVQMEIDHITAEDDRVAVAAHSNGQLKDGRTYSNTYNFLFFFRDGKIVKTREYYDTAYAREIFPNGLVGSGLD